ncbi:MAG: histone family protein [Methanosarcinales archaeon Met12]|nr:MAG: histone family protein [Methanosarcinales archaeon Met12]
MTELPLAPVGRIVRKAGAERVSEDARIILADILEDYGLKVSAEALKLAGHAGRRTIKAEDIKLAAQRL